MALEKARVQLLDPNSGRVVAEVDILTTSSAVSYINNNKTARDFRGIPAGTTFKESDNKSVNDVLDALLYPETESEPTYVTDFQGNELTEDTTIYVERFEKIEPFMIRSNILAGNATSLMITFRRFDVPTGVVSTHTTTVRVEPGSTYLYEHAVEVISHDTKIQIEISDGVNTTISPMISYEFVYPVFWGYCYKEEIMDDEGIIIDQDKAANYFNTLIRNDSIMLRKEVTPIKDIYNFNLTEVEFHDRKAYPCLIYPNTWNKPTGITDANDDNITGSFLYNSMVPIKPNKKITSDVQYTVYVNRNHYWTQLAAAGKIVYHFLPYKGSLDHTEEGVPSLTGFDVLCRLPLDLRTVVETYNDLSKIEYTYNGLVVYIRDIRCYVMYDDTRYEETNTVWYPIGQFIHHGNSGIKPDDSTGTWGDIYIDFKTGDVYEKDINNVWHIIGNINSTGNNGGPIHIWKEDTTYLEGEVCYYDNKVWEALVDTKARPGTNGDWAEIPVSGNCPGPVGPPGDAATLVVEKVVTGLPGTEATIVNIGDKQNARWIITIPRGDPGDAVPSVDKTLTIPGSAADAEVVGTLLKHKIDKPIVDGNIYNGNAGDVLISDGNGGTMWINFHELFEREIVRLVAENKII